ASWFGVKRTVLGGIAGTVVTTILFAFAHAVWLIDLARFLQGAASACSWVAALAWLVAESPAETRGRLLGSAMGAGLFGALLGPVVGGIASFAGVGLTFSAVASLGVLLAVWAAATPSTREPLRQPLGALARSLGNRRILLGVWFVAVPSIAFGLINVLASLRLSVLGVGAAGIGATWLVAAGVEATASPL